MNTRVFLTNIYWHEMLHFFSGVMVAVFVYFFYHSSFLSLVAFFSSFVIDFDHYFESLFYFKFNVIKIVNNKLNCWIQTRKMTIFFHSWELVFLILLFGWKLNFLSLALSVGISMAVHLVIDTLVYSFGFNMPFYQYFFLYRAFNKFDFVKLYNEGKSHKMTYEEINDKYGKKFIK